MLTPGFTTDTHSWNLACGRSALWTEQGGDGRVYWPVLTALFLIPVSCHFRSVWDVPWSPLHLGSCRPACLMTWEGPLFLMSIASSLPFGRGDGTKHLCTNPAGLSHSEKQRDLWAVPEEGRCVCPSSALSVELACQGWTESPGFLACVPAPGCHCLRARPGTRHWIHSVRKSFPALCTHAWLTVSSPLKGIRPCMRSNRLMKWFLWITPPVRHGPFRKMNSFA